MSHATRRSPSNGGALKSAANDTRRREPLVPPAKGAPTQANQKPPPVDPESTGCARVFFLCLVFYFVWGFCVYTCIYMCIWPLHKRLHKQDRRTLTVTGKSWALMVFLRRLAMSTMRRAAKRFINSRLCFSWWYVCVTTARILIAKGWQVNETKFLTDLQCDTAGSCTLCGRQS